MVPTLKIFGTGSLPWSPLGRGYLTRPHDQQTSTRANSDRNYARFVGLGNPSEEAALRAINSEIESIAQERGYSMAQVALAWSLSQEFVSAPIIGTTNLASLKELVQACSIVLTKEEIERINKPYVPRGILGH
jgi:aryl-alcohol dehydrogenase-like predicted oxidoreductase